MLCKNCGTELPAGTKFCTNCGTKQEAAPGGKKRNALFIIVIVILSFTTLAGGIMASAVYRYFSSRYTAIAENITSLQSIISDREAGNYTTEEVRLYDLSSHGYISLRELYTPLSSTELSIVPWKHPKNAAAVITKIYYKDIDSNWDYAYPAEAAKTAYLCFDFVLTGDIPTGDNLLIRIIQTSTGKEVRGWGDWGRQHAITVTEKKEYSIGWGSASGGFYERGWYLIQIIYNLSSDNYYDYSSDQTVIIGQRYVYFQ